MKQENLYDSSLLFFYIALLLIFSQDDYCREHGTEFLLFFLNLVVILNPFYTNPLALYPQTCFK
ncbi:hypothetical protein CCE28_08305 [Anaeromicrobium sediminis]|uniref:Uncharacterized protein n=1 Tax=Anaeromicrobium sediminis TaxID=1478221 RepID=A0A267MK99_9FIRM|nr:hypothetical protein CCE28_08305 [Anaeromicrobium sediminis]